MVNIIKRLVISIKKYRLCKFFILKLQLLGVDYPKYCCSQGMTVSHFETREEMDCLFDFFTSMNESM
jgi:hypothetical protein